MLQRSEWGVKCSLELNFLSWMTCHLSADSFTPLSLHPAPGHHTRRFPWILHRKYRAQTSSHLSALTSSHRLWEGPPSSPPDRHNGLRAKAGWTLQREEAEQHPKAGLACTEVLGENAERGSDRTETAPECWRPPPTARLGVGGWREHGTLVPSGSATNASEGQTQDLREAIGKIHVTTVITQQHTSQTSRLEQGSLFLKQSLGCSKEDFSESL